MLHIVKDGIAERATDTMDAVLKAQQPHDYILCDTSAEQEAFHRGLDAFVRQQVQQGKGFSPHRFVDYIIAQGTAPSIDT